MSVKQQDVGRPVPEMSRLFCSRTEGVRNTLIFGRLIFHNLRYKILLSVMSILFLVNGDICAVNIYELYVISQTILVCGDITFKAEIFLVII